MNIYYLVLNGMYDAKHIVKKRWYHKIFGPPSLKVSETKALCKKAAEIKFRKAGHDFGFFH